MLPELAQHATDEAGWRVRMSGCRNGGAKVAVLVDMVQAHMPPGTTMQADVGRMCAGLLRTAKGDGLWAVTCLWRAMAKPDLDGDVLRYAYGIARRQQAQAAQNGAGGKGQTMSAAELLRSAR